MNSIWFDIILLLGVAVAAFLINFALSAVSYAIAAMRFDGNASPMDKHNLPRAAQKLVAVSKKVGTFCILGIRFFLMIAFISLFLAALCVFRLEDISFGLRDMALVAFLTACFTLFVHFSFCDLPAAASAAHAPIVTLRRFYRPYTVFYYVIYPFEFVARKVSEKIFGSRVSRIGASFDHIDVQVKLRAEEEDFEELTPYAKKIVRNSIRLNELEIADVMIPRNMVEFLDVNDSVEENLAHARKAGHTRYPLCDSNLDHCMGIVHIKDIFRAIEKSEKIDLMKIKRGIMRVKHDDDLITALSKLRRHELHMAFVEDEFGGIIGILTLDGILEEIVGQIKEDYHGSANEITRIGKNTYSISGLAAIHNVEDFLDVDFENDEVSTFGGLITQMRGRFPDQGEKFFIKDLNMRITVEEIAARRIVRCKVEILGEEGS